MLTEKRKTRLWLIAAVLLAVFLFTACASGASRVSEKIELGQKYLTELNYTEAVAAFTEVIKINPSNIEAYVGRAEAYKGLKQYEEAKTDYTTVIEKAEDMLTVTVNRSLFIPSHTLCTVSPSCEVDTFIKGVHRVFHVPRNA